MVDAIYGFTTLVLCSWIIVYSCKKDKVGGVWVLGMCIMAVMQCLIVSPKLGSLMLSPLFAWIIVATLLNTAEVQIENLDSENNVIV